MNKPTETKSKMVVMRRLRSFGRKLRFWSPRTKGRAPDPLAARRLAARRERLRRRLRLLGITLAGLTAAAAAALAAGAWSQHAYAPTGQVLAVVNGREITTLDLQAEARASGLSYDHSQLTALLTRVVDRTLLAQEARRQHLDQVRTFPADKLRSDDVLLARQLTVRAGGVGAPITDQDALAYVAAHPELYAQRSVLRLRQLRFEADDAALGQLGPAPTLQRLQDALAQARIPFTSALVVASSSDLPPQLAQALGRLPQGYALIARQGRQVVASAVEGRESRPSGDGEAVADARARLERVRALSRVTDELSLLRRDAKIVYQVQNQKAPLT